MRACLQIFAEILCFSSRGFGAKKWRENLVSFQKSYTIYHINFIPIVKALEDIVHMFEKLCEAASFLSEPVLAVFEEVVALQVVYQPVS